MKVRLVCTSKRRVPENGIEAESTWAMSITSPVRIRRVARSTVSGFMWLPDPRSSPAPHFEGQRWFSAGGRQDWAWEATLVEPTTTAMTLRMTTGLMGLLVGPWLDARRSDDGAGPRRHYRKRSRDAMRARPTRSRADVRRC